MKTQATAKQTKEEKLLEMLYGIKASAEFGLERPTVKNMRRWLEDIHLTVGAEIGRIVRK